jgi:hypothetical protein
MSFAAITFVLLLNECLLLFVSLLTQSGNFVYTFLCQVNGILYIVTLLKTMNFPQSGKSGESTFETRILEVY